MYSFEIRRMWFWIQGNRRWQPVVLVEEELYHLSISTVIFSEDIVLLLYNHRNDV